MTGEVPGGEIIVYETADGNVRVDVRLDRDTVWLTQEQMSQLFGRERSVITKHVRNVFREGELDARATASGSVASTAAGLLASSRVWSLWCLYSALWILWGSRIT